MKNVFHPATDRSPEVRFDYQRRSLSIRGESYPEDVAAFYGPILGSLEEFLKQLQGERVELHIELVYFNSSSAKALMNLFLLLEAAARAGNDIVVTWYYAEDDATMHEFGTEFSEDLTGVTFNLKAIPSK